MRFKSLQEEEKKKEKKQKQKPKQTVKATNQRQAVFAQACSLTVQSSSNKWQK